MTELAKLTNKIIEMVIPLPLGLVPDPQSPSGTLETRIVEFFSFSVDVATRIQPASKATLPTTRNTRMSVNGWLAKLFRGEARSLSGTPRLR